MRHKKTMKWIAAALLLTLALAAFIPGTGASHPAQQPDSVACGDSITCSTADEAVYVKNTGTGPTIYGHNTSTGDGLKGRGNPGVYGFSYHAAGVRGKSRTNMGVKAESDSGAGVYATSDSGYAIQAASTHSDAIYVDSAGDDGLYVDFVGDSGVHVYNAGGTGMFVSYATGHGFDVYSAGDDGLHVSSAASDGVQISEATNNGIYVYEAGAAGMFVANSAGHGFDVFDSGDDGVHVSHATDTGVFANTDALNNEWGVYTPDKIYAGVTLATGGPLMFVAQNSSAANIEPGDVIAAAGLGAPLADSTFPTTLVHRADSAAGDAVVGVVYSRFVAEEKVEEFEHEGQVERHTYYQTHSTEGPIAPGEYLLYVVLGTCPVKVDALHNPVHSGDLLIASPTPGHATSAGPNPATGALVGKALEPLAEGQGMIWVLVDLQ